MNEKYKFTIDKLVSIKEIIKNIEENNYIDGYLGYEDDFYIDSILYYLKENARLKDKIENATNFVDKYMDEWDFQDEVWQDMNDLLILLKEN